MITRRQFTQATFGALLAFALAAGPALAHAEYERSEPATGATIPAAPARVDIWFTQELFRRRGENFIRVVGPDGIEVQQGEAQVDDDDRRRLWVALPSELPAGEYRVEWRSLSAEDGDTAEGNFHFTVDPGAAPAPSPQPAQPSATPTAVPQPTPTEAPTPTPTAPSGPGGLCGSAALPLVGLLRFKRRRRQQSEDSR